jgi:hypothetical protein
MKFNKSIKYSFTFVSLISPLNISDKSLLFNRDVTLSNKIKIKQSYVLLTWFYYLSNFSLKNKNRVNFFVLPQKNKKFTLTKSPMAHKNWSKEQYKQQLYLFKVSFSTTFIDYDLKSLNNSLFFILLNKNSYGSFETNIFFIKNFTLFFCFLDSIFFNYFK